MCRHRPRSWRAALAALLAFSCLAILLVRSGPALAQSAEGQKVEARLVAEPEAIVPGQPFWVSLSQRIAPGWHTYWRNPGDSGQATHIDWQLPPGFVAEPIAWPVPERLPYGPLMNFGYSGAADLLVRIVPPADLQPGDTALLRAEAEWLVCSDVCIPEFGSFELALPVAAEAPPVPPERAAAFHAARAALPAASPWPVAARLDGGALQLELAAPELAAAFAAAPAGEAVLDFFPDEDGLIVNAGAQELRVDGDHLTLSVPLAANADPDAGIAGLLVAQLPAGPAGDAASRQGFTFAAAAPGVVATPGGAAIAAAPAGGTGAADGAGPGLVEALLLALLGGAILNLMPCVFPVIAMKAMGLMAKTGAAPRSLRLHGLAYAAGVLVAFGAIGGVLLAVKAGGAAIGWGFQLQSPVFVALMAYLMLAVGLNLSGLFTVGERLMGVGQTAAARPGHAGAFLTGLLASAVAAPCTAPFMATAIGYAVTQSAPVAMAVLLAVGLGMALPYLLLTWIPGALRFLPRPGAWMERLRQFLAFPMYGAAAWLAWVLSQQAGPDGVILLLGGGVLLALALWLWQLSKGEGGRAAWRIAGRVAAAAVLALAIGLSFALRPPEAGSAMPAAASAGSGPAWESYSPARLAALQAEGRPVFVNMTAAWCITCKVNEQIALSSARMRDLFEAGGIAYLKGDWTNQDPEITRLLERFGRSGVPLYVLFAPDGGTEVLPQILTEQIVADALARLPAGRGAAPPSDPATGRRS